MEEVPLICVYMFPHNNIRNNKTAYFSYRYSEFRVFIPVPETISIPRYLSVVINLIGEFITKPHLVFLVRGEFGIK